MPTDLSWLSYGFPFVTPPTRTVENIRSAIMNKLPSKSAARIICDIYFRHAAWMYVPLPPLLSFLSENSFRYTPISEDDLYETIFRQIYDPEPNFEPQSSQNIGVFCMVLAIGILLDLDKPAHSAEAMSYYHLARAALSIDSILDVQTIAGIQALVNGSHRSSIYTGLSSHTLKTATHVPLHVFVGD